MHEPFDPYLATRTMASIQIIDYDNHLSTKHRREMCTAIYWEQKRGFVSVVSAHLLPHLRTFNVLLPPPHYAMPLRFYRENGSDVSLYPQR